MKPVILIAGVAAVITLPLGRCVADTLQTKPAHVAIESAKDKKTSQDQQKIDQMVAQLDLSTEQHKAIVDIYKKEEELKYAILKDSAERMDKINEETEQKILGVLTPEQKAKYEGPSVTAVAREDEDGLLKIFK